MPKAHPASPFGAAFVSRIEPDKSAERSAKCSKSIEQGRKAGRWYATGTVPGMSEPHSDRVARDARIRKPSNF